MQLGDATWAQQKDAEATRGSNAHSAWCVSGGGSAPQAQNAGGRFGGQQCFDHVAWVPKAFVCVKLGAFCCAQLEAALLNYLRDLKKWLPDTCYSLS